MTRPQQVAVAVPVGAGSVEVGRGPWALVAEDVTKLVRPRIALLVLATVASAYWLTAGRPATAAGLLWLLTGTALVAASSSIANQILERHADRLMPRTAERPLAAGRLGVGAAWIVTLLLLVGGALAFEQFVAPARVLFGQISDAHPLWGRFFGGAGHRMRPA